MADIKAAALYLKGGNRVERACCNFVLVPPEPDDPIALAFGIFDIQCGDGGRHELSWNDLLADDWRIAR